MSNNPDVSKIPARTYTDPLGCFGFMLLGAILIAAPFLFESYISRELIWWMYAVPIGLGIIALYVANRRRKGLIVNPREDKISYGFSSIALSDVESATVDHTVKVSNGNVSEKWYVVVTGPFGSRRFRLKNQDQAHAAYTFICQIRRLT